jgi:hypothetical protein
MFFVADSITAYRMGAYIIHRQQKLYPQDKTGK